MRKGFNVILTTICLSAMAIGALAADEVEILGVKFPTETVVQGKSLKLNGVSYLKKFGFVKVYAVGLYLEKPTRDPDEVIASEQIKQLKFHYLTSKATARKLQDGFLELMEKCNPPEAMERNRSDVERYASWFDKDMKPGLTSMSTYVPGQGLTMEYQGVKKGIITNPEFIKMYYTYNFGEKSNARIRNGLLGK